ncbi:MAG: hypothetical protein K2K38_03150 [Clostridia bacterium]|nr:hypothetical protein [Clostridia bacterium]
MKHLRKIGILIIAIIMVAAIAVGICVVYAVRNVNVTFSSYSDDEETSTSKIIAIKEKVLEKVRGRVISSISEEDVSSCLDDDYGDYYLESFEKVYPCTINITVQQRREVFAVYDGEKYSVYDDSGKFLRVSESNVNSCDPAPNLIIEGVNSEDEIKEVASICSVFKTSFKDPESQGALRKVVEKVTLKKSQTSISVDSDRIIFSLWCGLSIEIQDYQKYTVEKISKAYKRFCSLSQEEQLKGRIYSFEYEGEEIKVEYNANA